jgi:WD40 repeat protein
VSSRHTTDWLTFPGYQVWDIPTKTVRYLPVRYGAPHNYLGSTKNGLLFLHSNNGGLIDIWNYKTCRPLRTVTFTSPVLTAAEYAFYWGKSDLIFSFEGGLLAGYDYGREVRVWEMQSGKLIRQIDTQPVSGIAFSPDGSTLATVHYDGTIRFWRIK